MAHLRGCLDEELKRDLHKTDQGVEAADMTEAALLEAVKKLAYRIKMGKANQTPGVSIRIFHAQLKVLAIGCDYTVTSQCQCDKDNTIDFADNLIQDQLVSYMVSQTMRTLQTSWVTRRLTGALLRLWIA